jgi:hypothetical protein
MQRKKLSSNDIGILFFLAAIIFGTWFRINPPRTAGFPINDGALFYKMIETIQENNFRLPVYIEYNQLQIPFAYPPQLHFRKPYVPNLLRPLWKRKT